MIPSPACISCGAQRWLHLPALPQAMLSDGRVVPLPLAKSSCLGCGLARHATPLTSADLERIFSEEYGLYAHTPGAGFERERQHVYASWLLELLGDTPVTSLFEAGCGNGSLLQELRRLRPSWRLSGIEPAPEAVAAAQAAGLDVRIGYVGAESLPDTADVVVAINTVEHVEDPIAFLRLLGACIAPGGRLVIICPNADVPAVELLIYDHVHSFSRPSLHRLASQAGFTVTCQGVSPEALGSFQALVLTRDIAAPGVDEPAPSSSLTDQRIRYLQAWRDLDEALLRRCPSSGRLEAFGAGEAAGLLRAYAPRTWSRVQGITYDGGSGYHGGLPVSDYATLEPDPGRALMLALRPAAQATLASRLEGSGHRVIRWDDLLPT